MLPLSAVCRKVFPPLEKCCSLGPVSSSHSLFRPPLVILTGIINAAASRASASFPPTQQSVSLEMRRRAWRKSGRLIRPPPPPPSSKPSQLPIHSHLCCLYAALVVRQQFTEWTSNNTGSLAFMSLLAALFCLSITTFQQEKGAGARGSKPAIFTWT